MLWKCICGNYNTENKCIKCGRLKTSEHQDSIFKWNVSIRRRYNNVVEESEYVIDIFKIRLYREINLTKISIMVMPESFGKSSHRAITIDTIEEKKYLHDTDIANRVNDWLDKFKERIKNIYIK